ALTLTFLPTLPAEAQPRVPVLERTLVPRVSTSNVSTISSNFNGTAIAAGRTVWFNSVLNVTGLGANPVKIYLRSSTLQFTAGGTPYTVHVPDATITFSPAATLATTTFDAVRRQWLTTVPAQGLAGNTLLAGAAFVAPAGGLPGGINPGSWTATFYTHSPGVPLSWAWAAAVYTSFSSDFNALGVKPVDDNQASIYKNSDHAGTPESFKSAVTGGARGGGGSNYTGSYSGTATATPALFV